MEEQQSEDDHSPGGSVDVVPEFGFEVAETIQEYFENPSQLIPNPAFIAENFYIDEDTPLILAIRNVNVDAVVGLLSAGINPNTPNQKGVTPISAASHKGDVAIIHQLVEAGASVNALNSTGSTALIQASHFGHLAAVNLLLRHGGISDYANNKGTTALMRASQEGYVDIVMTLLAAKSEVNRKNNEGMNSLMLASQRGHEQVVLVLVKYGAAMDEQTSQGSTALMLACKRGHERVVEVLVACGAEIYMRDCRARSARDTALRRNHTALLTYLDTQLQVKCLQRTACEERASLLRTMRRAAVHNELEYSPETSRVLRLMQKIDSFERLPDGEDRVIDPMSFYQIAKNVLTTTSPLTPEPITASYTNMFSPPIRNFTEPSSSPLPLRSTVTFPTDICVANINSPVTSSFIATAPYRARHPLPTPISPSGSDSALVPHRPGYAPWQWPVVMMRVFDLPLGVHELVIEFLPSPRLWKTCIQRLKRRVTLAPQASTLDISILLDEMITDMCIFRPPRSHGHLVTISRREEVAQYLKQQWHMPVALVDELIVWSDVQSLVGRSSDCDVSFKANSARKFLKLAISMYRYMSSYSNPRVLFSFSGLRSVMPYGTGHSGSACTARRARSVEGGMTSGIAGGAMRCYLAASGSSGGGDDYMSSLNKDESSLLKEDCERMENDDNDDSMDVEFLVNVDEEEEEEEEEENDGCMKVVPSSTTPRVHHQQLLQPHLQPPHPQQCFNQPPPPPTHLQEQQEQYHDYLHHPVVHQQIGPPCGEEFDNDDFMNSDDDDI